MTTTLTINSTDNEGKAASKNIPYVSPDASNSELTELAKALNSLTTNTYTGAVRTNKEDITDATAEPAVTPAIISMHDLAGTYHYGDTIDFKLAGFDDVNISGSNFEGQAPTGWKVVNISKTGFSLKNFNTGDYIFGTGTNVNGFLIYYGNMKALSVVFKFTGSNFSAIQIGE